MRTLSRSVLVLLGGLLVAGGAVWARPILAADGWGVTAGASDCSDRLGAPKDGDADQPVLVLVETDPWAMVIGSDSPRFALYESGLAIYRTEDGFRQTMLDGARVEAFKKAVKPGALACLERRYSLSNWTDQPSENLFFGRGGALSGVSVYGRIEPGRQAGVPAPLAQAYERMAGFDDPKSRPWTPDFVEVMVWPYDYAPDASIIWPKKWPGLTDARTVKRGDSYSLFVPSRDYAALQAFLKKRREKGAVEIDGKKWAVSLRFPFPQEASWRKAGADFE